MPKNKILIVGKGELGMALDHVLGETRGNQVIVWGKEPNLPPAKVVFMAVPTIAIKNVAQKVKKTEDKNTILVVLSKGLGENGKTPWELARQIWQGPQVLISGPMIAEELVEGEVGYGLVASEDNGVVSKLINVFEETNLKLEKTDDLVGLSWAGPLKNGYAIGLGVASGKGKGTNFKGNYVVQAVKEMGQIITHFGGQKDTAYSLAGLGDLIATGFSSNSSNFEYGRKLAQNNKPGSEPEGLTVVKGLKDRLDKTYFLLTELIKLIDK